MLARIVNEMNVPQDPTIFRPQDISIQSQSSAESSDEEEHDWIRMYLRSFWGQKSVYDNKKVEKMNASQTALTLFSKSAKIEVAPQERVLFLCCVYLYFYIYISFV